MVRLQGGFTLLEMLVVIVLISLAAGLVGFGLHQGLKATDQRQAVGQMVDALRQTRSLAIISAQPARAIFDMQGLSVQVPGRPPRHWPAALHVTLHTAEEAGSGVEFYPDGSSTGGHVVIASDTRHWRIDIGWLTGRVQWTVLE